MLTFTATFIGEPTPEAFLTKGEQYTLGLPDFSAMHVILLEGKNVDLRERRKAIAYSSLSAFLRNWDNVKHKLV